MCVGAGVSAAFNHRDVSVLLFSIFAVLGCFRAVLWTIGSEEFLPWSLAAYCRLFTPGQTPDISAVITLSAL